jgi:hypothetical protein
MGDIHVHAESACQIDTADFRGRDAGGGQQCFDAGSDRRLGLQQVRDVDLADGWTSFPTEAEGEPIRGFIERRLGLLAAIAAALLRRAASIP